jgi:hypothetical protein
MQQYSTTSTTQTPTRSNRCLQTVQPLGPRYHRAVTIHKPPSCSIKLSGVSWETTCREKKSVLIIELATIASMLSLCNRLHLLNRHKHGEHTYMSHEKSSYIYTSMEDYGVITISSNFGQSKREKRVLIYFISIAFI